MRVQELYCLEWCGLLLWPAHEIYSKIVLQLWRNEKNWNIANYLFFFLLFSLPILLPSQTLIFTVAAVVIHVILWSSACWYKGNLNKLWFLSRACIPSNCSAFFIHNCVCYKKALILSSKKRRSFTGRLTGRSRFPVCLINWRTNLGITNWRAILPCCP